MTTVTISESRDRRWELQSGLEKMLRFLSFLLAVWSVSGFAHIRSQSIRASRRLYAHTANIDDVAKKIGKATR